MTPRKSEIYPGVSNELVVIMFLAVVLLAIIFILVQPKEVIVESLPAASAGAECQSYCDHRACEQACMNKKIADAVEKAETDILAKANGVIQEQINRSIQLMTAGFTGLPLLLAFAAFMRNREIEKFEEAMKQKTDIEISELKAKNDKAFTELLEDKFGEEIQKFSHNVTRSVGKIETEFFYVINTFTTNELKSHGTADEIGAGSPFSKLVLFQYKLFSLRSGDIEETMKALVYFEHEEFTPSTYNAIYSLIENIMKEETNDWNFDLRMQARQTVKRMQRKYEDAVFAEIEEIKAAMEASNAAPDSNESPNDPTPGDGNRS